MNRQEIIRAVESASLRRDLPEIRVGDTVDVHYRILEGNKERIQIFNGVVIAIRGSGSQRMFTVRRIVANEGVERIFPLYSPKIAKIEIKRHAHVRRAKLYYLRERVGKRRRLRDAKRGLEAAQLPEQETPAEATPPSTDTTTAASASSPAKS